jgi:hypothetical protein
MILSIVVRITANINRIFVSPEIISLSSPRWPDNTAKPAQILTYMGNGLPDFPCHFDIFPAGYAAGIVFTMVFSERISRYFIP